MREIKFRFFNNHTNAGPLIYTLDEIMSLHPAEMPHSGQWEREEFSGFLDKNGVEICDGDIVHLDDETKRLLSVPEYPESTRQDCLVGMTRGCWMFARDASRPREPNTYLWMWHERVEVIGNIHEHPRLLTEGVK